MKIAFTSTGPKMDALIDSRFGRADYIVMYNEEDLSLTVIDNTSVQNEAHGAGTATAQKVFEMKPDVLITGNGPGENAATALKRLNMKIFINAHNISLQDAYLQYKQGKLEAL